MVYGVFELPMGTVCLSPKRTCHLPSPPVMTSTSRNTTSDILSPLKSTAWLAYQPSESVLYDELASNGAKSSKDTWVKLSHSRGAFGSVGTAAENGRYQYQVTGVAKGIYEVVTGSDIDLDNVICDAGESCGAYPILGRTVTIEISEVNPTVSADMFALYENVQDASAASTGSQVISPIRTGGFIRVPAVSSEEKSVGKLLSTQSIELSRKPAPNYSNQGAQ